MLIPTIGLEIHCELKTESKLFCSCANAFGGKPNTRVCPICLGLPGSLPKVNERAVRLAVTAGVALGCRINRFSRFDRKHYFYPDLPKAWQTTQNEFPLVGGGAFAYRSGGEQKTARIRRIHLEEDAGKLIHIAQKTKIDYNRCGVPLIEIVTEPDFRSAQEAVDFLAAVRETLLYCGVSDCKMQEGSLRADVNLSVAEEGAPLGVRTETKNLNSFRAVFRAIESETARQTEVLLRGGVITRQTRRWNDEKGEGSVLRVKETEQDYRFFPEPDLLPLLVESDLLEECARIPELPLARRVRYATLGLSSDASELLTKQKELSDLFDACLKRNAHPLKTANFLLSDCLRLPDFVRDGVCALSPTQVCATVEMLQAGVLSSVAVKELLPALAFSDRDPEQVAFEAGLRQSNDEEWARSLVELVLAENARLVADYRGGNAKLMGYFVGQVVRKSNGRCNPKLAARLLQERLQP